MEIKAVLFDLHGTLAYIKESLTDEEVSGFLLQRGYEVSPQQFRASSGFVSMVDYPKYGYSSWRSYLSRILWRLKTKIDDKTLDALARLFESRPYELYADAGSAVACVKKSGFKVAIVTTIACFKFEKAIKPIEEHLDLIMTGYKAKCDKSNPRMYQKVLEILDIKPQETVMVGDELLLDVKLPTRLGINAILLDREGRNRGQLVDAFVYNLNEAMETIIRQSGQVDNPR